MASMQQIKIFKSVDTELPEMEKQINRWMRKSGARVLSITGNLASQLNEGGGPLSFASRWKYFGYDKVSWEKSEILIKENTQAETDIPLSIEFLVKGKLTGAKSDIKY